MSQDRKVYVFNTGDLSDEQYKLDLQRYLGPPVAYSNVKREEFTVPVFFLGGNYHAACVDESDKTKLQEKYQLIPFNIDDEKILGLQTFGFSSAPRLVKKVARLSMMSTYLHDSWKIHRYGWLQNLSTELDKKYHELLESWDFQQSQSKKRIEEHIRDPLYQNTATTYLANNPLYAETCVSTAVQVYVLCHSSNDSELDRRVTEFLVSMALLIPF